MEKTLTPEQHLELKLDMTYDFCKQQEFKRYETILYMQAHCKTDTNTITDYLNRKENEDS